MKLRPAWARRQRERFGISLRDDESRAGIPRQADAVRPYGALG